METLALHILKVIICSAILFGYYFIFLKDKTFHHYNRFYLLASVLVSLLLPWLKIDYFTIEVSQEVLVLFDTLQPAQLSTVMNESSRFISIVFIGLGLGALFLSIKFLIGIWQILKLKKHHECQQWNGISFYLTELEEAPFSFFKNLFWKKTIPLSSDLGQQILKHEMVHIEQKHSWDKSFLEVICAVFWCNPFFWLIRKEMGLIHEYLADQQAVKEKDTQAFAQMLLASHFSGTQWQAAHLLLSSNIKKRLKMITKTKTKHSYLRKLLALPILFIISFAYLVNAKNKEIIRLNTKAKIIVKEMEKSGSTQFSELKNESFLKKMDTLKEKKQHEAKAKQHEATEKQYEAERKQIEVRAKQLEAEKKQHEANAKKHEAEKKQYEQSDMNMKQMEKAMEKMEKDMKQMEENMEKMEKSMIQIEKDMVNAIQKKGLPKSSSDKIGAHNHVTYPNTFSSKNVLYTLDGKEISREELNKYPVDKIKRISVFKNGDTPEVKVESKEAK